MKLKAIFYKTQEQLKSDTPITSSFLPHNQGVTLGINNNFKYLRLTIPGYLTDISSPENYFQHTCSAKSIHGCQQCHIRYNTNHIVEPIDCFLPPFFETYELNYLPTISEHQETENFFRDNKNFDFWKTGFGNVKQFFRGGPIFSDSGIYPGLINPYFQPSIPVVNHYQHQVTSPKISEIKTPILPYESDKAIH